MSVGQILFVAGWQAFAGKKGMDQFRKVATVVQAELKPLFGQLLLIKASRWFGSDRRRHGVW